MDNSTPMFNFSTEDILALIEKILSALKKAFAWLGILILPEEEETTAAATE